MSHADQGVIRHGRWLAAAIMLGVMTTAIDSTIANVALPHIQGSLSAGADQIPWVLTSYIVASAVSTPLSGWLAGRFGRKNVFLAGVACFTVASMLCGAAVTLPQIVLFRLVQGATGALLAPMAQAQLLDMNPREKHGQAMALFGMGTMLGPTIGPVIGGYLTDSLSWRWCFYINLPLGLLAFVGVWLLQPAKSMAPRRRFDFPGFALLALAVATLQLTLDRGPGQDWFSSAEIWTYATVGVATLWMFALHSATTDHPFFDPRLIGDWNFTISVVLSMVLFLVLSSSVALLPTLVQTVLGYPVGRAGMLMAPRGIGAMLGMLAAGRLVARVDARLLVLAGLVFLALATWQMSQFDLTMGSGPIIRTGICQGAAMGVTMTPLTTFAYVSLPQSLRAEGASVFALMRNTGQSLGISVMETLLSRQTQPMHASLAARLTPSDPIVHAGLTALNDPATTAGAMALDGEISRQASMVAYLDDFRLMMLIAVLCLPLLLLMRGPRDRKRPA